jgi:hypothetical protein
MNREIILRRRLKLLTWFFIVGLVISGATAIPLKWELDLMTDWLGLTGQTSATATTELSRWLLMVREALHDVTAKHPQLFLGTDWLAFGHFVIAIAFIGARPGAESLAVRLRSDRLCAGHSVRDCVWCPAWHSILVAAD